MDVFAELKRFIEPFDASAIEAALLGRASVFDVDGAWKPHHHGRPRTSGPAAFDGDALLAGMQAVCFLGTYLPATEPMRKGVPGLYAKIVARLANPELLLYGGYEEIQAGGGVVVGSNYTYFCPAKLTAEGRARISAAAKLSYPNVTYPWASLYPAYSVVVDVEPLVACEHYELDPRVTSPALVAEVHRSRGLDEDAATLYLQLLALADCSDVLLRAVNGWTPGQHKKAGAKLAAAKLVNEQKQPRANRKYVLAGTWEKLFAPHPAIERWKLELYGARMEGKGLAAPLGRLVPLRPIGELFSAAWARVASADAPDANRPTVAVGRDWVAEIRAAPDDDALRMVYGDWLTEQGDPRGELVALQCRRVQLARAGEPTDAIAAAETALLAKHGDVWAEQIHSYVEAHAYDRGFITSVRVHAPTFVKRAKTIVDALPFLEELELSAGGPGPIPRAHIVALSGCEAFSKITRLDLTNDHYLMSCDELELLLEAPHLPRLRWLRFGFHRGGEGWGKRGAELLAGCARLTDLRFLEVAGQNLELAGLRTLLAPNTFPKLEMLRVPYNGLKSADAASLVDLLEDGALPALRVLDVSNVLETEFVTAACSFHRNRVDLSRQHALLVALAARRGAAAQYENDNAKGPAQGGFTAEVLVQSGRYPFAERAKSGTSKCVACKEAIERDSVRIGIERVLDAVGKVTSWVHPACRNKVPELQAIANLDERLTENSDVWPPGD
ncbi:MAG: TIGR02996 domain-containing protein [Myxococcota bacterium]|nr:TIGR02996 domain-containing protein [Myxococcota bacterium]